MNDDKPDLPCRRSRLSVSVSSHRIFFFIDAVAFTAINSRIISHVASLDVFHYPSRMFDRRMTCNHLLSVIQGHLIRLSVIWHTSPPVVWYHHVVIKSLYCFNLSSIHDWLPSEVVDYLRYSTHMLPPLSVNNTASATVCAIDLTMTFDSTVFSHLLVLL